MNSGQIVLNYKECYFAKIPCPFGVCGHTVCLHYCFCIGSMISYNTALIYNIWVIVLKPFLKISIMFLGSYNIFFLKPQCRWKYLCTSVNTEAQPQEVCSRGCVSESLFTFFIWTD